MAGYKHRRSGGSEGSEQVSPLASQLQQAWLQTQMPKLQKRTFTSASSVSSQQQQQPLHLSSPSSSSSSSVRPSLKQSALKSLSAIFPEIGDMPEEAVQPVISSVFEDGEEPTPIPTEIKQRNSRCLDYLFANFSLNEKPTMSSKKHTNRSISKKHTNRSISEPLIEPSLEFCSNSLSGISQEVLVGDPNEKPTMSSKKHTNRSISEPLIEPSLEFCSNSLSGISQEVLVGDPTATEYPDLDSTAEKVSEENKPFLSYLSDILMEESVEESKCMFMEISSYQAMAKELGDLIGHDSSSPSPPSPLTFPTGLSNSPLLLSPSEECNNSSAEEWFESLLNGPLPVELANIPGTEIGGDQSAEKFTKDLCDFDPQSIISGPNAGGDQSFKKFTEGLCNFDPQSTSSASGTTQGWDNNGCKTWESEVDQESQIGEYNMPFLLNNNFPAIANSEGLLYSVLSKEGGVGGNLPSNGHRVHIPPVDLTNLLIRCAEAVERSDFRQYNELIDELRQHSSAYGNGPQRMAHYVMEALIARMSGTGAQLYTALSNQRPTAAQMLKGFRLFYEDVPLIQTAHNFANDTILEAFVGASRVHIVDYGISYGLQWPCLIYRLSQRPGGPPHLRITGIDKPQSGFTPSAKIRETGRRLARLAECKGVPFEYHAIAEKWEAITPAHLMLREDEVLAVNCMFRLRHTLDETVTAASPRETLLNRIRSMNPKVFVQGLLNAEHSSPFFMPRFRSAISHFSTLFDILEVSTPADHPDRLILDQDIFGREILNVVACEGLERVERAEHYRQWQSRTLRAGFQQVPTNPAIVEKIRAVLKMHDRNYGMGEDGSWFLMGWKGHILHAFTAWEPAPVNP